MTGASRPLGSAHGKTDPVAQVKARFKVLLGHEGKPGNVSREKWLVRITVGALAAPAQTLRYFPAVRPRLRYTLERSPRTGFFPRVTLTM